VTATKETVSGPPRSTLLAIRPICTQLPKFVQCQATLPAPFLLGTPAVPEAVATPSPSVFVSAHSKGLTRGPSVSAESKGPICTKIVQNRPCLGTAYSKGLSSENKRAGNKKTAVACRLSVNLYRWHYERFDSACQVKTERGKRENMETILHYDVGRPVQCSVPPKYFKLRLRHAPRCP